MKTTTKTIYECELCGWKSESEERVTECEASHHRPVAKGEGVTYVYDRKFMSAYPYWISLKMDNGAILSYRYERIERKAGDGA